MRSSQSIAIWLFERLGLDVALTGDLLEECERGRSAIWYWRQVLMAVWIGVWRAVRDHKALALRAVATGFATEFLLGYLWSRWGPELPMFSTVQWITQFLITLVTQVATGWIVARTHRVRPIPMVLMFLIFHLTWYLASAFFWARTILAYVDQPSWHPYLVMYLMTLFAMTAGILLGGILGARPKSPFRRMTP